MRTASRLLHLLSLLQTRGDWSGSLLASRLGVSQRTIRRDIDRLRELGYNIRAVMGPDGGYRMEPGRELPPLIFDDDQALAVAVALLTAPTLGAGIGEAAIRAFGTIRRVMPSRLRRRLEGLEVTTVARPGSAEATDLGLDVLLLLAQHIRDRQVLRFDYAPRDPAEEEEGDIPTARRVEPHHLAVSDGRCYLAGWDVDRECWRLYRADRIRPRIPSGPRFSPREVPGGDVAAFVAARFKGSSVDRWPCRGTVRLELPARDVIPFVGDGSVTAVDEHSCTLAAGSWSWGALAAFFGRFEVEMHVIEPPELASAFTTLAQRYAATGTTWGTSGQRALSRGAAEPSS